MPKEDSSLSSGNPSPSAWRAARINPLVRAAGSLTLVRRHAEKPLRCTYDQQTRCRPDRLDGGAPAVRCGRRNVSDGLLRILGGRSPPPTSAKLTRRVRSSSHSSAVAGSSVASTGANAIGVESGPGIRHDAWCSPGRSPATFNTIHRFRQRWRFASLPKGPPLVWTWNIVCSTTTATRQARCAASSTRNRVGCGCLARSLLVRRQRRDRHVGHHAGAQSGGRADP
jgi:hypothetical protein